MSTIVITGGHHNSALVVAREFIQRGYKVAWIGHRFSSRGDRSDSAEYTEVIASNITFHDLIAGRMVLDLSEMIRFPLGIIKAIKLLRVIRPVAILSFGGYLGGTVALAGKFLSIPIYLHEQTVTAGRANKLIGRLATKIYLTWQQSAKYFNKSKVKVVGLPLRESILSALPKPLFSRRKPTLIVMGGKQGAHVINQFIFTHLRDLLADYNIIHQTGTSTITADYPSALKLKDSLASLADCYHPLGYIREGEIGSYLRTADYYLGRSGAHICYELGVLGLPSILIPLSSTHDREQYKNAAILVNAHLATILPQSELTLTHFRAASAEIGQLSHATLALPLNATTALVDDILTGHK